MKEQLKKISTYLYSNFSLDLRSLALLRMLIALVLILDLVIRSSSLIAFYTDEGLLPLKTLYTTNWNPSFFSVYCIGTGWKVVAAMFFLNFLFAVQLFFGYKTRFATVMCWIFIVSLHNRNPIILQGGDELLRMILFWGIFMPWGKRYSIDNLLSIRESGKRHEEKSWYGMAAFGYTMLIFSVYFVSALLKTSPEWRSDFTALYYALSLDQLTWPLGKALLPHAGLLKVLTALTFYLELLAPFLLLIPWKNPFFRMCFVVLLFGFNLFICLTLYVGLFFLINWASLSAFLSGGALDKFEQMRWVKLIKKVGLRIFNGLTGFIAERFTVKINFRFSFGEGLLYQLRLLYQGILFFIVCFCALWSLGQVQNSGLTVNRSFYALAYTLRLDHNWGMFAPSVFKGDGWYIYEAATEDGKMIDLNRDGAPVNYSRPDNFIALVQDDRWRKFGEIWPNEPEKLRKEFCGYLRRKWSEQHPHVKIKTLKIVYMKEETLAGYKTAPIEREVYCDCDE